MNKKFSLIITCVPCFITAIVSVSVTSFYKIWNPNLVEILLAISLIFLAASLYEVISLKNQQKKLLRKRKKLKKRKKALSDTNETLRTSNQSLQDIIKDKNANVTDLRNRLSDSNKDIISQSDDTFDICMSIFKLLPAEYQNKFLQLLLDEQHSLKSEASKQTISALMVTLKERTEVSNIYENKKIQSNKNSK